MNTAETPKSEKIEEYVANRIRQRYDTIEKQRDCLENMYAAGKWDIVFDDFFKRIKRSTLSIAKNEQEADILINAIFNKVQILPGKSGGDHHPGYFQDYDVSTAQAIALAENINGLSELLRNQSSLTDKPKTLDLLQT